MVVPVGDEDGKETRKYVGNGLRLRFDVIHENLHVIGNGCRVHVGTNNGLIKTIGNGCRITLLDGNGRTVYIGNDGCILVAKAKLKDRIRYVGNGGRICDLNTKS